MVAIQSTTRLLGICIVRSKDSIRYSSGCIAFVDLPIRPIALLLIPYIA